MGHCQLVELNEVVLNLGEPGGKNVDGKYQVNSKKYIKILFFIFYSNLPLLYFNFVYSRTQLFEFQCPKI